MIGPLTYSQIAAILTILLGGGALGTILRYRTKTAELHVSRHSSDREADRTDFEAIVAELRQQRDEFKVFASEQVQRNTRLEAEIQGLRLARDLDPFPNWVVDRSGEYLYVNREFERTFLEPLGLTYRHAIGKTHESLGWPTEFCEKLRQLDHVARSRPDGTARAVAQLNVPNVGVSQVTVHKFPVRLKPSGVIVAYNGYITGIEPINELVGLPAGGRT